jgi:hypothetical protein
MSNENPITYEELSEEHKQRYDEIKLLLRPISSARLRGPVTTASGGRGFHLKGHSTKWIYLPLRKNELGLSVRRSITWWLTHCIDILRVW